MRSPWTKDFRVNRHKGNNILSRIVVMVTKDGIAQHYIPLTIPITGILLDPRLELRVTS